MAMPAISPEMGNRATPRTRAVGERRPWPFLYLAPEPHQQGSFRPIRSPVGVYPGRAPPVTPLPFEEPVAIGSSPSDARTFRRAEPPVIEGTTEGPLPSDGVVPAELGAAEQGRAEPGPAERGPAAAADAPAAAPARAGRAAPRPLPAAPARAGTPWASDAANAVSAASWRWTVTRKIVDATP